MVDNMPETPPVSTMVDPKPLDTSVLVSALASAVGVAVAARLADEGYANVRPSYGYLIQHLLSEQLTATELARRVGISKQAASKSVHELHELGLVEFPGPDRRVALSVAGLDLVAASRRVRAELEQDFAAAVGDKAIKLCRATLTTLIETLGGEAALRTRRLMPPAALGSTDRRREDGNA
jgi:DNA-binding MarR family transcriptional regulator